MASLLVRQPEADDRLFPLRQHHIVLIGRDDQCTLQIIDELMSRRHLQVRFDESAGRHYVHDYESANGVFVNERRVKDDVALIDGDRIRAGATTLVYLQDDHDDVTRAQEVLRKMDEWKRDTVRNEGP